MQTPLVYILLFGAAIQVTGSALLSTVPTSSAIPAQVYVYQGLVGFGTGINLACLIVMTPFAVEKRDKGKPIPDDKTALKLLGSDSS
jgi:hypothetical protein